MHMREKQNGTPSGPDAVDQRLTRVACKTLRVGLSSATDRIRRHRHTRIRNVDQHTYRNHFICYQCCYQSKMKHNNVNENRDEYGMEQLDKSICDKCAQHRSN